MIFKDVFSTFDNFLDFILFQALYGVNIYIRLEVIVFLI